MFLSTHLRHVIEIDDKEDGCGSLLLEAARQFDEQVHGHVPHPPDVVVQLPILHRCKLNAILHTIVPLLILTAHA